jgi:hypothetical protein
VILMIATLNDARYWGGSCDNEPAEKGSSKNSTDGPARDRAPSSSANKGKKSKALRTGAA